MILFDRVELPEDYTRKCTTETRPQVNGAYKGLIYCRAIDEGNGAYSIAKEAIARENSDGVPVKLKRGCSEYALEFLEFARTKEYIEYSPEWQSIEENADAELIVGTVPNPPESYKSPHFAPLEARIMLGWLRYAATIGDPSHLKISGRPVLPFPSLERPPFKVPNGVQKIEESSNASNADS